MIIMFDYELITVAEVAVLFRCSSATVYNLIRAGHFPCIKRGRNLLISKKSVENYVQALFAGK